MTSLTNLPSSFNRFNIIIKSTSRPDLVKPLRRFAYRFRLAKSFTGIQADGFGRSLNTYSAITKLFFTYTAYESVSKISTKLHIKISPINFKFIKKNKTIADKIRANTTLSVFLKNNKFNNKLNIVLDDFFNNLNDDVISVAFALRNSFAHGNLTTTDVGNGYAADCRLILSIADFLLSYCDELFDCCIEKL